MIRAACDSVRPADRALPVMIFSSVFRMMRADFLLDCRAFSSNSHIFQRITGSSGRLTVWFATRQSLLKAKGLFCNLGPISQRSQHALVGFSRRLRTPPPHYFARFLYLSRLRFFS